MKILVLELARLGDIYQSWPALRALKRLNPMAQITVLTRERYKMALEGLSVVDRIEILPTQQIIQPLLEPQFDVQKSHQVVGDFVEKLKSENFNWIINFSFSPVSSYLTHALSNEQTRVSGYTRTSDGFLAIPDDMSAYFYAQVGVHRPNRYHLAEIFGTMVGADLSSTDWAPPLGMKRRQDSPQILIHVGASQTVKTVSPIKWITVINQFRKLFDEPDKIRLALVGAASEASIAEQIVSSVPAVENLVGQTNLRDLFEMIGSASLLVGADSAPMHMASLTATPCLNLSLTSVNFWETGPRAPRSVIMRGKDDADFPSDKVAQAMRRILMNEPPELGSIVVQEGTPSYWCLEPRGQDFQWKMLKAIYMSESFPLNSSALFKDGIIKLDDINRLMIDQLEKIQSGTAIAKVSQILDRGEEIITTIAQIVPDLSPVVRWYNTEKIRLGPDTHENLVSKSLEIHRTLQKIVDLYKDFFAEEVLESSEKAKLGG
jgi:heptosyltransferase-3